MVLIVHIFIAIFTVITSLATALKPAQSKSTVSKIGVVLTLMSGGALALTSNVSLGHLCASGIAVVSVCSLLIAYGSRKLAYAKN